LPAPIRPWEWKGPLSDRLATSSTVLTSLSWLLHRKHCGVETLTGFVQLLLAPQPRAHAALVVPLLVVDIHHHVVVVSVVEILLLLGQQLCGLSLGQGPSNSLLLAVVLTGKVAVPEYWSRLKLDLLLRLFALNMMRRMNHVYASPRKIYIFT